MQSSEANWLLVAFWVLFTLLACDMIARGSNEHASRERFRCDPCLAQVAQ